MDKNIITNTIPVKHVNLKINPNSAKDGVLAVMETPLAFIGTSRNNHEYSQKVWENVMQDPAVIEDLYYNTMLGELDHPSGRDEVLLDNTSHRIRDLKFDGKTVSGTVDILDTQKGNTLLTLLKSGARLGVSARAVGKLDENNITGKKKVDESTYKLITFDFVSSPGFEKARVPIQESYKGEKSVKIDPLNQKSINTLQKIYEGVRGPRALKARKELNQKLKDIQIREQDDTELTHSRKTVRQNIGKYSINENKPKIIRKVHSASQFKKKYYDLVEAVNLALRLGGAKNFNIKEITQNTNTTKAVREAFYNQTSHKPIREQNSEIEYTKNYEGATLSLREFVDSLEVNFDDKQQLDDFYQHLEDLAFSYIRSIDLTVVDIQNYRDDFSKIVFQYGKKERFEDGLEITEDAWMGLSFYTLFIKDIAEPIRLVTFTAGPYEFDGFIVNSKHAQAIKNLYTEIKENKRLPRQPNKIRENRRPPNFRRKPSPLPRSQIREAIQVVKKQESTSSDHDTIINLIKKL